MDEKKGKRPSLPSKLPSDPTYFSVAKWTSANPVVLAHIKAIAKAEKLTEYVVIDRALRREIARCSNILLKGPKITVTVDQVGDLADIDKNPLDNVQQK